MDTLKLNNKQTIKRYRGFTSSLYNQLTPNSLIYRGNKINIENIENIQRIEIESKLYEIEQDVLRFYNSLKQNELSLKHQSIPNTMNINIYKIQTERSMYIDLINK